MAISIIKPEIEVSKEKPTALANKGFPYCQLADHRRFEELVYSVYKTEIELGNWKSYYDDIYILQGVRERGRDCVLYKAQKSKGIIQCKHSNIDNRLSKPDACKEIIKFILHSILDDKLIDDISDFTYYFASSSGFTEPAKNTIDNFKSIILKEANLKSWIDSIINSNSSLASIIYDKEKVKIEHLLSNLSVKCILPQDIDILLGKEYNTSISNIFFEIRTVTDNYEITKLREEVIKRSKYQTISNRPLDNILDRFKIASFNLAEYNNEIENIPDSHIERKETSNLFDWIKAPLQNNDLPICVLAGNAGYGKTVILKDLYDRLVKSDIPVLGLKSDKLYANSLTELEMNKIQLEDGIDRIARRLLQSYDKVVFIVDQLDALSQSLSSNREYLDTYNQLIQKLIRIDGVRVIASVRIYDLNFDTAFTYYKKQKIFTVGELDDEQLKGVLAKKSLDIKDIPSRLTKLLRVPNNLNVFCQIYLEGMGLLSIGTLHDLYKLFWKQKLVIKAKEIGIDSNNCIETIYAIASKMFNEQKICISSDEIINQYYSEVEYLKSNNVIVEKNGDIQFFHQTFYDFVFSKMFVEKGGDILQYIRANNQSLFIRSSVVMVMSFLRQNNEDTYIKNLKALICKKDIKFHLKLLIVNTLAFESSPNHKEKQIVEKFIVSNKNLKPIFLESLYSREWLLFLDEKGFLKELLPVKNKLQYILKKYSLTRRFSDINEKNKNVLFRLLIKLLPNERDCVLRIINELPNFDGKGAFVLRALYYLKKWDLPIAKLLFEENQNQCVQERFDYYKILEDAVVFDIDWVLSIYKVKIFSEVEKIQGFSEKLSFKHEDVELLKKVFDVDREKAFIFYYELIKKIILKTSSPQDDETYYIDSAFWFYVYDKHRSNSGYNYEEVLHKLIGELKEQATRNTKFFKAFVSQNKHNKSQTVNIILIHAFISNPNDSIEEIFQLFERYFKDRELGSDRKIDYYTRKLINCSYSLLNNTQKKFIESSILAIRPKWENEVYTDRDTNEKKYRKSYGYTQYKYLKSIPEIELVANKSLNMRMQELERKDFRKWYKDEEPNKFGMARAVPPPLPNTAYANMKFEDWEKTFLEYEEDFLYRKNGETVSMLEHSRSFETRVEAEPELFYPFVKKLVLEAKVPQSYILKGLEGLKKANFAPDRLLELVIEASRLQLDREHSLYLVWLTDYFIQNKNINTELISYLSIQGLNHSDPEQEKEDGGVQKGINSVRGAAVQRLIQAIDIKEHQEVILKTLSSAVKDKSSSVRATIMNKLAFLLNINKPQTLEFFLELIDREEESVYEVSVWSAGYISYHYFSQLKPYFKKAIKNDKIQDEISVLLAVRWLEGKPNSFTLLKKVLKNSDKAKSRMVEVALANFKDKDRKVKRKSKYLFCKFLNSNSKDLAQAYSHEFLRLSPERFNELFGLLKKYAKSKVARNSPHYFYEYLRKCAKEEPLKTLSLLAMHKGYIYDANDEGYREDDAIKALLNIYNTIRTNDKHYAKAMNKCMKLFDLMLMNPSMRHEAKAALDSVDS